MCNHDVAGRAVGHAQHALKHYPRLGTDQLVVLSLGKNGDEFVDGIWTRMNEFDESFEESALVFFVKRARGVRFGHCLWMQDML